MPFTRLIAIAVMTIVPAAGHARAIRSVAVPAAPRSGFRAEVLADLADVEKRILLLASAVPADRYGWRPAAGVRSVSEVYMHIAGGNYTLANFVGTRRPVADERNLELITEKPRVVEELRKSFDYLRNAILTTSDNDLGKPVKMFGSDTTERAAMITALNHLHEHLGQSVAYARMNGVVPPWSQ